MNTGLIRRSLWRLVTVVMELPGLSNTRWDGPTVPGAEGKRLARAAGSVKGGRMGLWHVFYEDWQMECCGTPFGVGDEVGWPLLLQAPDPLLGGGPHDLLTELAGPVEEVGGVRLLRGGTGLVVALGGAPDADDPDADDSDVDALDTDALAVDHGDRGREPGGRIRSAGLLRVERHGAAWPETAGRVRTVQVLTQAYAETAPGSRVWEPVQGQHRLRPVDRCPKWFADAGETHRGRRWREAGVLVTLEVPGTDSGPSPAAHEARGTSRRGAAPGAERGRSGGPRGPGEAPRPVNAGRSSRRRGP